MNRNLIPRVLALSLLMTACIISNAQIYRTIANGNWSSSTTWVGNVIPPSNVPVGAQIIINHEVLYNTPSSDIKNNGIVNIYSISSNFVAKLTVPSGINFENLASGRFYMNYGTYRQYRFVGGGNSGIPQGGSFKNIGGVVNIQNSNVEVAQDWVSNNGGRRTFNNGCLLTGQNFELSSPGSIDTLINVKISIGWHGSGNISVSDAKIYFQDVKISIPNSGNFQLSSGIANGNIDNITFKHPETSIVHTGNLIVSSSVNTSAGLSLDAYCVFTNSNFQPNGKINNAPLWDCTISSVLPDCFQTGGILPVKYLSFDAIVNDKAVLLKWLTTQEVNNSYFEVERSFDMNNFRSIGMVLDGFVIGSNKSYQFKDNSNELVGRSVVYYRLKQFDVDGKSTYSKVIAVRLQAKADVVMQVSPNPFTENLNVRFTATESGAAQIRIVNSTGQTLLSKQALISKGYNNIQVEGLSGLATGMYVAQLIMNGTIIDNQRVIKSVF